MMHAGGGGEDQPFGPTVCPIRDNLRGCNFFYIYVSNEIYRVRCVTQVCA
jgi:hypothetical protein